MLLSYLNFILLYLVYDTEATLEGAYVLMFSLFCVSSQLFSS